MQSTMTCLVSVFNGRKTSKFDGVYLNDCIALRVLVIKEALMPDIVRPSIRAPEFPLFVSPVALIPLEAPGLVNASTSTDIPRSSCNG